MSDTHYLGEFQYLSAVWKMFPNGAGYGDYITIGGVRYYWDESTNSWGEDPGDVNPALPEIVNHDIDVQGTVIARDAIKTADYIPNEAGANIDHAGNAEFRSVNADIIRVQNPVTGKLISLAEFIKMFKTELPPDWTEYKQIPQFDDVRLLAFDPLSNERFYTTIGALKELIADSTGTGGSGTFDIEILRTDEPYAIPTDNNVMSSLRTLLEIQSASSDKYLSRLVDDTAQGFIEFLKGISVEELATLTQGLEVGAFTPGALGAGAAVKMIDGTSYAEVDNLTVRQKATFRELIIESLKHIGGQLVLTPASMKCVRVVEEDTFYKCYFDAGDGEVSNEFVAGDLARCQVFTGSGTKFYWRLVTLVGEDWINISKTIAAVGSDAPEAGDDIAQLGNATDTTRQNAQILSTVGVDAPSWKQYKGINSFSLEGKDTTVFSGNGNKISGETVFTSGGANLDDHLDGVAQDILDALRAAQDAEDKAQQAIEDAEANVATINVEVGKLQDQIDGKVSNWYYDYTPTLANYPVSDWTTNEIKDSHIGDTFTNTELAPAENAGKSWRFVKNGSVYSWALISDSDAIKALQEASKALAAADGKSTTHLFQPTKYKLGDMWVLNADQTVNGTLYKQGELLTATQDSETFNEAHWLKRVRYTDDTAVNNLEIGGRNLILNSLNRIILGSDNSSSIPIQDQAVSGENYRRFRRTYREGITFTRIATFTNEFFRPEKSGYYTYSTYFRPNEFDIELRLLFGISAYGNFILCKANEWTQISVTEWIEAGVGTRLHGVYGEMPPEAVQWIDYNRVSVTSGNKATDWTPAPEDVEANIATAKTEAENAAKAYALQKAEAERVKAEAYADGIVTDEEQARIDDVNDKLALAKEHADAQDALLKIQQEAYADEHISLSEQAAIQAAEDYADLKKTEAEAYADGIVSDEEARAIADALAKYNASKAHAEQLVKDIEIGGRNLLRDSGVEVSNGAYNIARYDLTDEIKEGEEVTLTIWGSLATTKSNFRAYNSGGSVAVSALTDNGDGTYSSTFKWKIGSSTNTYLNIYAFTNAQTGISTINKIKLEKGNKATDWTPAPEDVERELLESQGYIKARYIRSYLKGSNVNNNNTWVQIQALNKAGTNIALGKTVTASTTGTNLDRITNGVTDYSNTATVSNTGQVEWVQVDLGKVYYDIDSILHHNYWHSTPPTLEDRVFNDTKIEISTDGIVWKTIFDSAVSGTYVETEGGKVHTQRYASEEAQGYMKARYIRDYLNGSSVDSYNHWVQIKALNKEGINIALNKTVTSNIDTTNLARITNGNMDVENYARTSGGNQYVQIDLGDVHYDIDNISVHHYWANNRTYDGTKTQISEDGVTWKTIFDSAIEGTYKEAVGGKVHTQRHVSEEAQGFMRARFVRDWIKGNSTNNRNQWNEIRVMNKAGTNLAKGKIPTSDGSLINASYATDDNIDNFTYIATPSTPTLNYIQIDLEAIHYDIDYVHIWHYNGRTFNGTKTEISEDGVTWKTIFDSEISGTYVETEGGKVHTQRYASVMGRIAETEAKTRFQTLIDGGLIYTALMKLFDTISGDETAFISGKQGAGKNLPAFGAGGSYQDALAGTAKAIIRHDGSSKFSDTEITGTVIATSGKFTGEINALEGYIGGLTIKDGKLLVGDVGDNRIELDPSSRKMIFTTYDNFNAGHIGFDAEGALLDFFKRFTGSTNYSSSVRVDGYGFLVSRYGQSGNVTGSVLINPAGVTVSDASNTTEVRDDGVYVNGVKLGTGGGSSYTHPSSHPASMITGLHASATTGVAGSVAWGNVTGKPSTATTHPTWAQVTGKPGTFTPSSHTHSNITITAGNGLSGGGALSQDRTLTLGTPSTLTNATTNSATASTHTHVITTTTVGASNTIVATDASGGVRGSIIRIGGNWTLELSGTELVFKYNGVIKQRMLSNGTIFATGGLAALKTT